MLQSAEQSLASAQRANADEGAELRKQVCMYVYLLYVTICMCACVYDTQCANVDGGVELRMQVCMHVCMWKTVFGFCSRCKC